MTSFKKSLVVACAVSFLGVGAAYAQTDPAAPAAAAPAMDAGADAAKPMKPMMPMKHKMHKKHAKKMMMKKKMM